MRLSIQLAVIATLAALSTDAAQGRSLFEDARHSGEARRGVYVGFDVGQASYDLDRRDLDSQLESALQLSGIDVLASSSETSEEGFTYGIIVGYQFLRWLAIEAAYVDLGDAEYKSNADITDGVTTANLRTALTAESAGGTLSALGILPLWAGWDIYGRAGVYFGSNDATASASVDGIAAALEDSSSSTSFLWGGGVGYTRGRWTTRLDYQQFTDVGDSDSGETDVDRITFAAVYRFGQTFSRDSRPAAPPAPVVVASPVAD